MSSQTTPFSLELFSFVKQFAGIIEEHLVLGLTYPNRQALKMTYLNKSLPQVPTLVEPKCQFKKFV